MNQRALLIQRQVASKVNRTGHEFRVRYHWRRWNGPGWCAGGYVVFRFSSF